MSVMCNNPNDNGVYCNLDATHDGLHSGWHPAGYRTYWDDKMTADIKTTDDEMCPNCVTPWKCNGPHSTSSTVIEPPDTFQGVFHEIFDEAFNTLVLKQISYGPKNVEELGFYGVFSRLASDKVERLRNALNGKIVNGRIELDLTETLSDESLEDTLIDIINYGAILIAVKRGLWGKPLA